MPFKKYVSDGSKKFVIAKESTDETSLCKERKDAEAKLHQYPCGEVSFFG